MPDDDIFLPDIFSYLESNYPVSASELSDIIEKVVVNTELNSDAATAIVCAFFEEIRTAVLNNKIVGFRYLGNFYISSPKISNNKKRIFVKFKPTKTLLKRMNGKR
jgi:nucleoid DNA-binding protein